MSPARTQLQASLAAFPPPSPAVGRGKGSQQLASPAAGVGQAMLGTNRASIAGAPGPQGHPYQVLLDGTASRPPEHWGSCHATVCISGLCPGAQQMALA